MLHVRKLGAARLFQIVEFVGPTHDADWMLPGLPEGMLSENTAWIAPQFWMPRTNRLVFSIHLFVLKYEGRVILIDTGVGNHKPRLSATQNMLNLPTLDWLKAISAGPDDVTHVVHTHLHGDHIGWDTVLQEDGWQPLFTKAIHYVPRLDFEAFSAKAAEGGWERHVGPFVDSFLPVLAAGLVEFIEPGDRVADCLAAEAAPGHTPGQVTYALQVDEQEYIFAADVLHSPIQVLCPTVNTRWCELPEQARETRARLFAHAADRHAILFPAHFASGNAGLEGWGIDRQGEGFTLRAA